ncbi:MAG: hypothetical protein IT211_00410 [Armatimonadetes bacterium]|nr:hypothetical protein [Armatimonadota bacterium]
MMNQLSTMLLATLLLVGCRNGAHQSAEQASTAGDTATQGDSSVATQPAGDSAAGRETQLLSPERLNAMSYEDKVRNIYSTEKVRIPKQVMDSAMTLKDPNKINKILEGYMNRQDSGVRAGIATKLGISIDSLNKILSTKPRKP